MDGQEQKVRVVRFDPEAKYDFDEFDCGDCKLNGYLPQTMAKEFERRISIPHLCIIEGDNDVPPKVVGYFTLASSSFDKCNLTHRERRKVPYRSVPCILLSKIAVDKTMQGQGLGKWLLGKAIRQAFLSSRDVGVYALFLQAREGREEFYKECGMIQSTKDTSLFIYPLKQYEQEIKKIVLAKL